MTNLPGNELFAAVVNENEQQLLATWIEEQLRSDTRRGDLIGEKDIRQDSTDFLSLLRTALQPGFSMNVQSSTWADVREMLAAFSQRRANLGFTPSETANFVFSFKKTVFQKLRSDLGGGDRAGGDLVADAILVASQLLDSLGLYTTEVYQKSREDVILRQQEEMMELSTPVVKLWDGILALPLIGTLDSNRTQVVMESLLQAIVETGSEVAIIDITGVPTVDTLVSQHLLKTVAAARLMGADCIISGIRPQIAQTIVHLGVDLSTVSTKSSLAEAFVLALRRTGRKMGQDPSSTRASHPASGIA